MAANYNVALRVGYNGQAVSAGATRNAADLKQLQTATYNQGRASLITSQQNNMLRTSYTALSGAVSLYAAGLAGIGLVKGASNAELLQLRLDNLTTSYEQNQEAQHYLAQTADNLNVRYNVLADSYTRLLVLERQRTLSSVESRQILEGMTNVAKTLGATNVQVSQSMYGMTQALTQGRVQAQELNQVTEPLPGLLQALDKAAGTAAGGFRKMVIAGEVTSGMFKNYLITALQDYEGAAEAAAGTISGATNDFLTTYDLFTKKISAPINSAVVPLINTANDALRLLGDNIEILDTMADSAILLSAVIAGRLVGSIAAKVSATAADTVAMYRNNQAALLKATATTNQIRLELQSVAAMMRSAQSLQTKSALMAQASALTTRYTAAVAAQTAAERAASVAITAKNTALGILGGPVGLAVTAAIAIGYFATAANDATVETSELKEEVDNLVDSYRELNDEGRALQLRKLTEQETAARENLIALQARLREEMQKPLTVAGPSGVNDFIDPSMQNARSLERLQQDVNEAEALLNELATKKSALFDSTLPIDWQEPTGQQGASTQYEKPLADIENFLRTREERIAVSYEKRQSMLDNALAAKSISEQRYNELSTALELRRDQDLSDIQQESIRKQQERAREAEQARLRQLEESYENELAIIQGFEDRKALLQYQQDKRVADARNQQRILEAQGFASQSEKDEHSRQEALLDAQASRTGQVRNLLFSQAEWERKNELEKTNAVLSIGEFGFKQMAGQSKKAFALYKAFAITKAVINTYEMATGAFNALASIPYVGPALGAAAAAAAVAFGLAQVNSIKNQQYQAAYHGGVDYVGAEQTALIQKGERIVSPRQNVALTSAVDKINKGESAGSRTLMFHFNPQVNLSDSSDENMAKLDNYLMASFQKFRASLIQEMHSGTGDYFNAARLAAA
ncbi:tape measure protein [Alteromonas sp. KUL49]|uniref:tape measure protein n=1 Tax=Alteromonas sp. KUL49 TaxID=2480798 RepID=UPI00102F140D|nr:tape measure protein [Alteromonas sp. KUL49]TAP38724.1 hypothetical protein EYS00_15085 [Alteromonas sp. KUL49]GEA12678.1 hypothetical protein KUL49_30530 [Alteromonas sp. KUL49]